MGAKQGTTYYVVMHKQTRKLMPLSKSGRGYTHWIPGVFNNHFMRQPRLFTREQDAKSAIAYWAAGTWAWKQKRKYDCFGFFDDDTNLEAEDQGRKPEEMMVIPVKLRIVV